MGKLRLARPNSKRIDLPGGDWVEVREEISKEVRNAVISHMPDREVKEGDRLSPGESVEFQTGVFEALVTGWSVTDADGKPVPPSVENYLALSGEGEAGEAMDALDLALAEHFQSIAPTKEEQGKASTSRGKQQKASE